MLPDQKKSLRKVPRCATINLTANTYDHERRTRCTAGRKRGLDLSEQTNYYIVAGSALPEIFRKVAEAKRLLETGEAETVNDAVRQMEISRSAFYKYRDTVRPFNDMLSGRIITYQAILRDEPGVLSSILSAFADSGANILTINQSIPSNGCAVVTVTTETSGLRKTPEDMLLQMKGQSGVLRFEILAG